MFLELTASHITQLDVASFPTQAAFVAVAELTE